MTEGKVWLEARELYALRSGVRELSNQVRILLMHSDTLRLSLPEGGEARRTVERRMQEAGAVLRGSWNFDPTPTQAQDGYGAARSEAECAKDNPND